MMPIDSFLFFDLCSAIVNKDTSELLRNIKLLSGVSRACLAGFVITLCIHAYWRGDGNVMAGFVTIYRQDVLRRLYGDPLLMKDVYIVKSLSANVGIILVKYFKFSTSIICRLSKSAFL